MNTSPPTGTRHGVDTTLVVLGCDGSWVGPHGAGSGYLLRGAHTNLVLDLGPGTAGRLAGLMGGPEARATPTGLLDGVVITHRHADHWSDLHSLATEASLTGRPGPLPVFAPAGGAEPTGLSGHRSLSWQVVGSGSLCSLGEFSLRFARTDHGPETLAVRVTGPGGSLGYSADTGPNWAWSTLGEGLDVLLSEASFTVSEEGFPGHLSGRQAGQLAERSNAGTMILTHRWPTVAAADVLVEAGEAFSGTVYQAETGATYVLKDGRVTTDGH